MEITGESRRSLVVQYELYLAALRRPSLGRLSLAWDAALPSALGHYTDPVTARTLALAADALMLHSVIAGRPLTSDEVEPVLRRVIG
jgi:DNA-binding transcriptional regulator YbjK